MWTGLDNWGRAKRPARSERRKDAPQLEQARTRSSARSEPDPGPSQAASESPEPSLAQRRPRREIKPPGEWWKVKPSATPVQDSSSDEEVEAEDDEWDLLGNTAQFAQEASWPSNWHAAMKRSDAR